MQDIFLPDTIQMKSFVFYLFLGNLLIEFGSNRILNTFQIQIRIIKTVSLYCFREYLHQYNVLLPHHVHRYSILSGLL